MAAAGVAQAERQKADQKRMTDSMSALHEQVADIKREQEQVVDVVCNTLASRSAELVRRQPVEEGPVKQ